VTLDRLMGVASTNLAVLDLPHPAHKHAGSGQDGGPVGQMHGAQVLAGERARARRAAQRQSDELTTELIHRQSLAPTGEVASTPAAIIATWVRRMVGMALRHISQH